MLPMKEFTYWRNGEDRFKGWHMARILGIILMLLGFLKMIIGCLMIIIGMIALMIAKLCAIARHGSVPKAHWSYKAIRIVLYSWIIYLILHYIINNINIFIISFIITFDLFFTEIAYKYKNMK
ncbi:hypothetical protein HRbin15_00629 [bacterium HR15]|nr:hypothetical protein HRbin15_00629 [bacterium HR15]